MWVDANKKEEVFLELLPLCGARKEAADDEREREKWPLAHRRDACEAAATVARIVASSVARVKIRP